MSELYTEDTLDLGSPLKFEIRGLKLAEDEAEEKLRLLSYRCVIKDALDDTDDLYDFTNTTKPEAFEYRDKTLYFCGLSSAESLALEDQIVEEGSGMEINSKKLIGHIYLTLSFSDTDLGPENIIHLKIEVLKPAN